MYSCIYFKVVHPHYITVMMCHKVKIMEIHIHIKAYFAIYLIWMFAKSTISHAFLLFLLSLRLASPLINISMLSLVCGHGATQFCSTFYWSTLNYPTLILLMTINYVSNFKQLACVSHTYLLLALILNHPRDFMYLFACQRFHFLLH